MLRETEKKDLKDEFAGAPARHPESAPVTGQTGAAKIIM
jgi:hypothetical protein